MTSVSVFNPVKFMQTTAHVSIIICSRNRADSLKQTLESIGGLFIPLGFTVELLVVDSDSTDHTASVIHGCNVANMTVRYIHESRRGKSIAVNAALCQAKGNIILSTDDDVRPPQNWIEAMCQPILAGEADAVAGGVKLAPHLKRPELSAFHESWLACTHGPPPISSLFLVGANMAFSRVVLQKVPQFDPELGPGALGHADDTLFSLQVKEAGFRVVARWDVEVEHHLDPSRLTKRAFREQAEKRGEFDAYIAHHWFHQTLKFPHLRPSLAAGNLWLQRLKNWRQSFFSSIIPDSELGYLEGLFFYRHYLVERKRPRNYEKHGLIKLR